MAKRGRPPGPPKAPKIEEIEFVEASNLPMLKERLKPLQQCGWRLHHMDHHLGQWFYAALTREVDAEKNPAARA